MAKPLVANLLGPPRFSQAEVPVTCASRKALGLFAYLLLTIRQHSRRELAALLWGRRDEETRAREPAGRAAPPAASDDGVPARRTRVDRARDRSAPVVDVRRFESLTKADDLASLEEATELYRGEFLQDFEARRHAGVRRLAACTAHAPRADRAASIRSAIARRADRARSMPRRRPRARIGDSQPAGAGRRSCRGRGGSPVVDAALSRHRTARRRARAVRAVPALRRGDGRAAPPRPRPAPVRGALGRRGLPARARQATLPAETTTRPDLPRSLVPATSFVGRVEELAELDRLLADPHCRLLTLHGLGGAGKTRLAHALATQVGGRFAQGVAWVPLEAIDAADALPGAIATALRRELPASGDRTEQVAAMLAAEQRLLVLDNFESLLARVTSPTTPIRLRWSPAS